MRKVRRFVYALLLLILLAAVAGALYMYLLPMMETHTGQIYDMYTVRRGSIETENSFSATISIADSEVHRNTSRATAIREIYVTNGQEVHKGDKLMQLDNGEILKAGLEGVVTEMRFDTSDWLWNNVDLIQITDLTNLKVSMSVDEYDVRNVSAGQKCYVTIVPTGEVYETEISHVDRVSSSSGQVAFYTVTAELTAPESVLPGMTASVTIPSACAEDALILDMAALAFDEEKRPYVLYQTDAGYEKAFVETGLSDGVQVQILSGLNEGDAVWAVSAEEKAEHFYTLTDLYKKLVGEKIVINDMTGNDRNSRSGPSGLQMPVENRGDPGTNGSNKPDGRGGTAGLHASDTTAPAETPAPDMQKEMEDASGDGDAMEGASHERRQGGKEE